MRTLTAVYDLAVSPPTYDFVSFLLAMEGERIARGCGAMDVKIMPGPADGFRADRLPPFDLAARITMRDRIVVPMTRLLPSCVSCEVLKERVRPEGDHVIGFGELHYGFQRKVAAAKRNIYPFFVPQERPRTCWDDCERPYVTITLREADYWPTRNSHIDEWMKAAGEIERRGFRVVFVRDSSRADAQMGGFATDPVASIDLGVRAQLYHCAAMNLFINNGPAWLAWFMGVPCVILKMTSSDAPVVNARFFESCGFPPGSQFANARPGQRIVWQDDTVDAILSSFDEAQAHAA